MDKKRPVYDSEEQEASDQELRSVALTVILLGSLVLTGIISLIVWLV